MRNREESKRAGSENKEGIEIRRQKERRNEMTI